jgi:hypothetical protein
MKTYKTKMPLKCTIYFKYMVKPLLLGEYREKKRYYA